MSWGEATAKSTANRYNKFSVVQNSIHNVMGETVPQSSQIDEPRWTNFNSKMSLSYMKLDHLIGWLP